jgi:segregation and condensation protein A
LIERAELDITRLALAQVTDQFLEHLRQMPESAAEEVSGFLIVAAKLIQIKSEALLPRPAPREVGEEDPGDQLARQLLIYKRFKELANLLAGREAAGLRAYPRIAPTPKLETSINLEGVTTEDLLKAAHWLLAQAKSLPELNSVVPAPKVTIREKIGLITQYLRGHNHGRFDELLRDRAYRLDVVVTFLALLELVKRHMVHAQQDGLFGSIEFEPTELWSEDLSFEIEFGE